LQHQGAAIDPAWGQSWAELVLRAPFSGTVLEKNVALGDVIDPSLNLFKIADLRPHASARQRVRRGPCRCCSPAADAAHLAIGIKAIRKRSR